MINFSYFTHLKVAALRRFPGGQAFTHRLVLGLRSGCPGGQGLAAGAAFTALTFGALTTLALGSFLHLNVTALRLLPGGQDLTHRPVLGFRSGCPGGQGLTAFTGGAAFAAATFLHLNVLALRVVPAGQDFRHRLVLGL